jgi:hypothetical protein
MVWIFIAVVIILTLLLLVWAIGTLPTLDEPDDPIVFETEVIIADGGHFRHTLIDSWSGRQDVTVTITSLTGGPFDVYIMDVDQYENAYGNDTTGSFSFLFRAENVTQFDFTEELETQEWELIIIVDNTDNPLLAEDATPVGTISVQVRTETQWVAIF